MRVDFGPQGRTSGARRYSYRGGLASELFCSIVAACFLVLAAASSQAATVPLSNFVIFGAAKVTVGGSSLISGLVGSSLATSIPTALAVELMGAAEVNGDVRSAGNVTLNNGTRIVGTLYRAIGTTLHLGSPASVGAEVIGDPELPSLPTPTSSTSGGPSYTGLPNGTTLTLEPGSYGTVQLAGACTLNLSAGDYYFDLLTSGNGLNLNLDLGAGSIRIFVTGKADFGSVDVGLTNGGDASQIYLETHGSGAAGFNAFEASGGSDWLGDVFAPYGDIHFGGSGCCSTFQGRFHSGAEVDIEHAVTGVGPPVAVAPATWGQVKSLYRD